MHQCSLDFIIRPSTSQFAFYFVLTIQVESQELKLRKLRALRGQPNPNLQHQQQQNPQNNESVTADLQSIRSLFNEKEKELSMAVSKVEELTGSYNHLYS